MQDIFFIVKLSIMNSRTDKIQQLQEIQKDELLQELQDRISHQTIKRIEKRLDRMLSYFKLYDSQLKFLLMNTNIRFRGITAIEMTKYLESKGWTKAGRNDNSIFYEPPKQMGFAEGFLFPVSTKTTAPDYQTELERRYIILLSYHTS